MQVLIVDDDIATVDVIHDTIDWKELGVNHVFMAYNIEQAKKIIEEQVVQIVISDIEMPQGSGIDLLTWYREQGKKGEFLFLTCHERFDYATNAIKLQAAEYLLKPLDVVVMEAAIKKMVFKVKDNQCKQEELKYGNWAKKNIRKLELAFWSQILDGHVVQSEEQICQEIISRNLSIDPRGEYHLVISKVTDIEKDKERIHSNLMIFIMENIHSEDLCGNPQNSKVLCFDNKDYYTLVSICSEKDIQKIEGNCQKLQADFKTIFSATLTCCISNLCRIQEFYDVYWKCVDLIADNVMAYGSIFCENQAVAIPTGKTSVLELNLMEEMLNQKEKVRFLSYLKEKLNEKMRDRTLSEQTLLMVKQEVTQVTYSYLAKRGILVSGIFMDDTLNQLEHKASQSVIDIIRWVNYLLEELYKYENEVQKGQSIIEKINKYIREHYKENIGRNEIAAEFYLAPEYLSKMYKKQTGISLKDYICEYRIEQAKILLRKDERLVSDVAEEVGFDNFTYFSTLFKKYTGMTPNQYRKC